ncbi:hypothetical protein ACI65C_004203 [Semiaphis heraclei]
MPPTASRPNDAPPGRYARGGGQATGRSVVVHRFGEEGPGGATRRTVETERRPAPLGPRLRTGSVKLFCLAIEILESYIKSQLEKIKEEKSNEVISEDNSEENSVQNSEEKKMIDTQEIMNAVKNTEYSDDDIRLNNIFKSYKWLAELYGVLCNNLEPKISEYQKALKLNIDTAIKFKTKYILTENDDAHLTYLVYKWKNKTIIPRSKWEISIWPGGWILKSENFSFKKLKLLIFSRLNKNVEQLISLIDSKNTSFKYINLIEFYILMYRHFKEWKTNAYDDYDGSMYKYIKNAINNVVITAEVVMCFPYTIEPSYVGHIMTISMGYHSMEYITETSKH